MVDTDGPYDQPLDSLSSEPVVYREGKPDVLTPMGEGFGDFAHGLGARRVKIALAVGGVCLMAMAILAAIS